jgi:outer membrane protein TolC
MLRIARAGYDPNFTFSGQHSYSVTGGGLDANARLIPSSKTEADTFNSGFTGVGPLGLNYNLSGRVGESYGNAQRSTGFNSVRQQQRIGRHFIVAATAEEFLDRHHTLQTSTVAKNRLKVSELGLQQQIMNVVDAVEEAYYELILPAKTIKVQEKALQLAQRLFSENKQRVRDSAPLQDRTKNSPSRKWAASQANLANAQRSLATAQNTLKRLITASYRGLHDVQLDPAETLDAVPQAIDFAGELDRRHESEARPFAGPTRSGAAGNYGEVHQKPDVSPNWNITGSYGHGALWRERARVQRCLSTIFARVTGPFLTVGGTFSIPLKQ